MQRHVRLGLAIVAALAAAGCCTTRDMTTSAAARAARFHYEGPRADAMIGVAAQENPETAAMLGVPAIGPAFGEMRRAAIDRQAELLDDIVETADGTHSADDPITPTPGGN